MKKTRTHYSLSQPLRANRVEHHFCHPLTKSLFGSFATDLEAQVVNTILRILINPVESVDNTKFELYSLNHLAVFWAPTGFSYNEIWIEFGSRVRGIYSAQAIGLIATYYALMSATAVAPEESDHLVYNARMIRVFMEQQPNAADLLKAID